MIIMASKIPRVSSEELHLALQESVRKGYLEIGEDGEYRTTEKGRRRMELEEAADPSVREMREEMERALREQLSRYGSSDEGLDQALRDVGVDPRKVEEETRRLQKKYGR